MALTTNRETWLRTRGVTDAHRKLGAFGDVRAFGQGGGLIQVAGENEPINLTESTMVYYGVAGTTVATGFGPAVTTPSRFVGKMVNAGGFQCDNAAFGGDPAPRERKGCYVNALPLVEPALDAAKVADQGGAFLSPAPGVVYYGNRAKGYVSRLVHGGPGISIGCSNSEFGPDPAYGQPKECLYVARTTLTEGPGAVVLGQLAERAEAQRAAEAAIQAQRDVAAAQLVIQQQSADAAAQSAKLAENAAAQSAAALSAAVTYRQIIEEAKQRAADRAAALARIAAENEADPLAAEAAAAQAAEAEALQQAAAQAHVDVARQTTANQVAESAALVELRRQREAEARLQAAQEGSATQSEIASGGGMGLGFSTADMILYGGLALAALLLFTVK